MSSEPPDYLLNHGRVVVRGSLYYRRCGYYCESYSINDFTADDLRAVFEDLHARAARAKLTAQSDNIEDAGSGKSQGNHQQTAG